MKATRPGLIACSLLAIFLAIPAIAQVPDVPKFDREAPIGPPPAVPDTDAAKPEIQARGPVHEAFAQPGEIRPRPGPVAPKAPPEPIKELPPDIRPDGDNVAWVPGYWAWDNDRGDYLWISGTWRVVPPGRKWVPGYWAKTAAGHQWVSGLWADEGVPDVPYLDEPPPSLENGPSLPPMDDDSIYVPGTWAYNSRWQWSPGFWMNGRPGWVYNPARLYWTPRGYLANSGYWDRPLNRRGFLFAPAYFPGYGAGQTYTPNYVVGADPLLDSLWITPGGGFYSFGDYYGSRYARRGYLGWGVAGARLRDPLYNYYAFANRGNRAWAGGVATTYNARMRGDVVLPRTLAHQTRLAATRTTRSVAVVQPFSTVRTSDLPVARMTIADRATSARITTGLGRASVERRVLETRSSVRARSLSVADIPTLRFNTMAVHSPRIDERSIPSITFRHGISSPRIITGVTVPPLNRSPTPVSRITTPAARSYIPSGSGYLPSAGVSRITTPSAARYGSSPAVSRHVATPSAPRHTPTPYSHAPRPSYHHAPSMGHMSGHHPR